MGFRLSESEIAQKSWPSGAPTLAATASIAVTPGMIATSSARQLSGPLSIRSQTAAAIANTPGSPPGHDGNACARRGMIERSIGARAFLAIVRGVAALSGA
jgi:hypothetical protein